MIKGAIYTDEKAEQKSIAIETVLAELEKKDKIIDKMTEKLIEDTEWYYSEFDNYTKEQFIDYFEKKVSDKQ